MKEAVFLTGSAHIKTSNLIPDRGPDYKDKEKFYINYLFIPFVKKSELGKAQTGGLTQIIFVSLQIYQSI